jgi:hypothetical protein
MASTAPIDFSLLKGSMREAKESEITDERIE